MTRTVIMALTAALLCITAALAAEPNITAHSLRTEILNQNRHGATVGIKVNASNDGFAPGKAFIKINGYSGNGYELASTLLVGTVSGSDFKVLSGTVHLNSHQLDQINRWEIAEIEVYPVR